LLNFVVHRKDDDNPLLIRSSRTLGYRSSSCYFNTDNQVSGEECVGRAGYGFLLVVNGDHWSRWLVADIYCATEAETFAEIECTLTADLAHHPTIESKNATLVLGITLANVDRYSQFFPYFTQQYLCSNFATRSLSACHTSHRNLNVSLQLVKYKMSKIAKL